MLGYHPSDYGVRHVQAQRCRLFCLQWWMLDSHSDLKAFKACNLQVGQTSSNVGEGHVHVTVWSWCVCAQVQHDEVETVKVMSSRLQVQENSMTEHVLDSWATLS